MKIKDIVEQLCVDLEKALEIPNGLIIEQVLVEIARYALFENKAEEEIVDSGYDVSSHGRMTDQKFESDNEEDEFWDTFWDEEITYPVFINKIGKLPFLKIVEKFKEDATLLQTEIEIEEEKKQAEFERKSKIAQRVHEYVTQLAREESYKKFSMSEKEALKKSIKDMLEF